MQFLPSLLRSALSSIKKITIAEWLAILGLAASSAVVGFFASKYQVFNADATASIYLFKDPFRLHDILLADWHSNLLKIPLLMLQAQLPLNIITFTVVNVFLIFTTMLSWATVATLSFGRKYLLPLLLACTLLLSGTILLPSDLGFTTTRNIEYPLLLLAFYIFWRKIPLTQSLRAIMCAPATYAFIFIMFLLEISDPFFSIMSIPALTGVLVWNNRKQVLKTPASLFGIGVIIVPAVLAKAVLFILFKTGIFIYYGQSLPLTITSFNALPHTVWHIIHVLIAIVNADMFDVSPSLPHVINFIMMLAFLLLAYAYTRHVIKLKDITPSNPILSSLLVSTMTVLLLYVLISEFAGQSRFLTIVVLVALIAGVHEALHQKQIRLLFEQYPLRATIGILIASAALGLLTLFQYKSFHAYDYTSNKNNVLQINAILEHENVNTIIAGHSYSSPIAFWANGNLHYIPILYCNQNLPFLTRKSWYGMTRPASAHVAIIVDKLGRDANSWYCSDTKIQEYYGKPLAVYQQAGIDNIPVKILIYPKNVISKIVFITTTGTPRPLLSQ